MNRITIEAPKGYEFEDDNPRPPKYGEWYFSNIGEGVVSRASFDHNANKYILRKKPQFKEPQVGDFGVFSDFNEFNDFSLDGVVVLGVLSRIIREPRKNLYMSESGSQWKYFRPCKPIEFIKEEQE